MAKECSDVEDQLLVMDAQDGDRGAMETLVSRWQKRLWRHAFRLTGDRQAAWDVTQQSWLGIIKGLSNFHDPANFGAWAFRIATNKAIDRIKKSKAERNLIVEDADNFRHEEKEDSGLK